MSELKSSFSMPLMTEAQIEQRRTRLVRGGWVFRGVLAVGALGLSQWAAFAIGHHDSVLSDVVGGALLGTAATIFSWVQFGRVIEGTRLSPKQFEWLPAASCASFADACEKNPGLVAYRDKVRNTGRRFTVQEHSAMGRWVRAQTLAEYEAVAKAQERADCQRLYGVAYE